MLKDYAFCFFFKQQESLTMFHSKSASACLCIENKGTDPLCSICIVGFAVCRLLVFGCNGVFDVSFTELYIGRRNCHMFLSHATKTMRKTRQKRVSSYKHVYHKRNDRDTIKMLEIIFVVMVILLVSFRQK